MAPWFSFPPDAAGIYSALSGRSDKNRPPGKAGGSTRQDYRVDKPAAANDQLCIRKGTLNKLQAYQTLLGSHRFDLDEMAGKLTEILQNEA